jgi:hypothetical protein
MPKTGYVTKECAQGLRHHCRNPRCRMKLKEPVENPHKAFCTSGCHSSFYRSRCIVCEQPIMKRSSRRELCDKPKCQGAFRGNQQRFRYPTPANAANGSRNPHGMGIKTSPQRRPTSPFADAPLNILGGGSFRWPDTPRLDAETLEKIRIREVATIEINPSAAVSGSPAE